MITEKNGSILLASKRRFSHLHVVTYHWWRYTWMSSGRRNMSPANNRLIYCLLCSNEWIKLDPFRPKIILTAKSGNCLIWCDTFTLLQIIRCKTARQVVVSHCALRNSITTEDLQYPYIRIDFCLIHLHCAAICQGSLDREKFPISEKFL